MASHCITLHVTKLQCYLEFGTTVASRFLERVRSNRLFAAFTEGGPVFVFSWEILLSVFFYNPTGFLINIISSELGTFKQLCEVELCDVQCDSYDAVK